MNPREEGRADWRPSGWPSRQDQAAWRVQYRDLARGRPPAAAIERVGPGDESVWDFPRPPALTREHRPIEVVFAGRVLAHTDRALRVAETAGAPVYFLPMDDVDGTMLRPADRWSFCEWKGVARYWDVASGDRTAPAAAFDYPEPAPEFAEISGHVALYCAPMDRVRVGDAIATPQPGEFYAGWVTPWIKGPFKGDLGTEGW